MKSLLMVGSILLGVQSIAFAQFSAGERTAEARIQSRNAMALEQAAENSSPWENLSSEEKFDRLLSTYMPYHVTLHGVSFDNSSRIGERTRKEVTAGLYEGLVTQRLNLMENEEDIKIARLVISENIGRIIRQINFELLGGDITLLKETVEGLRNDVELTGNPNSEQRLEKIYSSFQRINSLLHRVIQNAIANQKNDFEAKLALSEWNYDDAPENTSGETVGSNLRRALYMLSETIRQSWDVTAPFAAATGRRILTGAQIGSLRAQISLLNLKLSSEVPREQALQASNALNTLAWNYSPDQGKDLVIASELAATVRRAIEKLYSDSPSEFTNQYYQAITNSVAQMLTAIDSHENDHRFVLVDRMTDWTAKIKLKNAATRLDRIATGVLMGYAENTPVAAYMAQFMSATGR